MAPTPDELSAARKVAMRAASVRVRAKKFAEHLRSERWAESIPDADIDWLKDEEIQSYMDVLIARGCVLRKDSKWEVP